MWSRFMAMMLVLVLSACNAANSTHPMLAAEPRSSLKLKDGLWAGVDGQCKFNAALPVGRWPRCVYWLVLSDNKVVGARDAKAGELPLEFVIADGKPPIVELPLKESNQPVPKLYAYLAMEPTRFASDGAAIDLLLWNVACGIYEKSETGDDKTEYFPGMDDDCHPASIEVLRSAAAAGPQGPDKQKRRMHWVRASAD